MIRSLSEPEARARASHLGTDGLRRTAGSGPGDTVSKLRLIPGSMCLTRAVFHDLSSGTAREQWRTLPWGTVGLGGPTLAGFRGQRPTISQRWSTFLRFASSSKVPPGSKGSPAAFASGANSRLTVRRKSHVAACGSQAVSTKWCFRPPTAGEPPAATSSTARHDFCGGQIKVTLQEIEHQLPVVSVLATEIGTSGERAFVRGSSYHGAMQRHESKLARGSLGDRGGRSVAHATLVLGRSAPR